MKKLLLTAIIFVQAIALSAGSSDLKKVKADNTKIYQQPASVSEVVTTVNTTDEIKLVRNFDRKWSIVEVNGQVGYIQTFKLAPARNQNN